MRIIVLVLALAFDAAALAGGQPAASPGPAVAPARSHAREVARVNGVPLTSDRLDEAVNRLIPLESFHRSVAGEKMAELRTKALRTLIDEELQYQEGVRLAVRVRPAEVDAAVASAKKRYRTARAFDAALRAGGGTVAELRREIRRALTIRKALDRVVTAKCQVDAAEAERFFADNAGRFVVPEQLHVYAITIGVDPSASAATWADARSRAEEVRRRLLQGASFEEMARTHSTDPSRTSGGDMGFVHRGSLNDEFESALRDLPPGQVSAVVTTLYGHHLVRLAEVRPPRKKAFADVGAELRRDLTAQRCADMKDAWIARLRAAASITP